MAKRKRHPRKYGVHPIGYDTKKKTHFGYQRFTLAEHLDDHVSAKVAQAEYQCMGHYAQIEPVPGAMLYYVWISVRQNRRKTVRLLPGEVVKRHKPKARVSGRMRLVS